MTTAIESQSDGEILLGAIRRIRAVFKRTSPDELRIPSAKANEYLPEWLELSSMVNEALERNR